MYVGGGVGSGGGGTGQIRLSDVKFLILDVQDRL